MLSTYLQRTQYFHTPVFIRPNNYCYRIINDSLRYFPFTKLFNPLFVAKETAK